MLQIMCTTTTKTLSLSESGFRPNHFCHTALTEVIDTWLSEININKLYGTLFIDFAKTLDVINYDLPQRKLTLYSLSSNSLSLICSFLNSRLQKVSLKDKQSYFKTVLFWSSRRICPRTLLFSICINDLTLLIPSAQCDMLADDTTIHKPVKTEVHDTNDASEATTTSLSAHLSFGNQQITEVSDHNLLGVTMDNNLTWVSHIRDLCKTTAKKVVYRSAKIKHFLNFHAGGGVGGGGGGNQKNPSTHSVKYRLCFNTLGLSKRLFAKNKNKKTKKLEIYTGKQSESFF